MIRLTTLIGAIIISFSANASIIEIGDINYDTSSQLEWLDLSVTNGYSYDYIENQLNIGGIYEGWGFATELQIADLIKNFGYTPYTPQADCENNALICDFEDENLDQEGIIKSIVTTLDGRIDGSGYFLSGMYGETFEDFGTYAHEAVLFSDYDTSHTVMTFSGSSPTNLYLGTYNGFFLNKYSEIEVPSPSPFWLFISLLTGLTLLKNKRLTG